MGLCRAVPRDRSQAWGPWTSELSRLVATSYEGNAWEGVAPPSLGCERGPTRWPVREAPTPASLTPVRRVLPGPPLPTGPPESRGGVGSAHTQGDPRGDGELWRPPGGEGAGGLPPQGRPLRRGCPRPRACRPPSPAVRRPIPPRCPGQGLCRVSEPAHVLPVSWGGEGCSWSVPQTGSLRPGGWATESGPTFCKRHL